MAGAVALGVYAVALFGSFYCNFWGVADDRWFLTHQHDTESLIVGRLVKSQQDGLLSAGGFPGAGVDADLSAAWIYPDQIEAQYRAYLMGERFEVFSPYFSQPGGQGLVLSLMDRMLPLPPAARLEVFYALLSLLSSLTFTSLIWWFTREAGVMAGGTVALSVLLSQWITVFGRNLWWNLWAFFVPMLCVAYVLRRRRGQPFGWTSSLEVAGAVFFGLMIKYLFNGFEFVTATLVMVFVPVVYETARQRWPWHRALRVAMPATAAAAIAVLTAVVLLVLQIAAWRGNFGAGVSHVAGVLAKRSHGVASNLPAVYEPALNARVTEVLGRYLRGNYFAVKWTHWGRDSQAWWSAIQLPYGWLIATFAVSSVGVLFTGRRAAEEDRRTGDALVLTTWFSLLAPISWFVVFKAHSYVHLHVNFIVWQMPFTLCGFAVIGWLMRRVLPGCSSDSP